MNMKLTNSEKDKIENQCQPLIEKFKSLYILKDPDNNFNYLIDIYLKWYRDHLYFCGKIKSQTSNRSVDEFEEKYVRLKVIKSDCFDLSYMRHTEKWTLVSCDLTLEECLKMIENTPTFHPVG